MYRHMIAEVSEQRLVTVSDHSPQELMRDAFNIANGLISNGKVQFEKDARTKEGGGSQIIFPTPDSDFQDKVLVLPVLALDVAGLCRLPEASALISAGLALKMLDSLIVHNTSKLIVARIDKKIEGKDLYEVMTEDEEINNNLNRLIVIGRAFLIALQDFQAHHLIHRDIKLENIMCSYQETEGNFTAKVQIIDYSDVCFNNSLWDELILGTLGYMPPEASAYRPPLLGFHTDIYAAGWVLMALYNQTIFEGINADVYSGSSDAPTTFDAAWNNNATSKAYYQTQCSLGMERIICENLYDLIMMMTHSDYRRRPSIAEVIARFNSIFPEAAPAAAASRDRADITDSSVSIVDESPLATTPSPEPHPVGLPYTFASAVLHPQATIATAQSSLVLAATDGASASLMPAP